MIERNYADPGLRAALGSSPPLEKMKMGHTKADQWCDEADRARDRKTERDAAQVLITELVGALEKLQGVTNGMKWGQPWPGRHHAIEDEVAAVLAKAKVQP